MSFTAQSPVHQLHPHQALAFVNRWVKLKDYWYNDDREALYNLKDRLLQQWVQAGTVRVTAMIERESPVIAGMRQQLASGGADLEALNWADWDILAFAEHFQHWQVLVDVVNEEIQVPIPPDMQAQLEQAHQLALAAHAATLQQHQEALNAYPQAWQTAWQTFKTFKPAIKAALETLLQDETQQLANLQAAHQSTRDKRSQLGELKQSLGWIRSGIITAKQLAQIKRQLREHGVELEGLDRLVLPSELKPPAKPSPPRLFTTLKPGDYVSGSLPHVEAALAWARAETGRDLTLSDIDDDLVNWDLESVIRDEALDALRKQALVVFQSVLNGRLATAKAIYDALTALPLDYGEALGMRSYIGSHETQHGDFKQWHTINLSPTGNWLLEFESTVDPSVCFHMPYDRALKRGFAVEGLPRKASEQATFGRAITPDEQRDYPLAELLAVLGLSMADFPYELQQYRKAYADNPYSDWEDDEDEFDEFDDDN